MGTALQNIFAMYCIMVGAYFLKKRSLYPVEVVNNLVFNFFLPVTVFHSLIGVQHFQASAFTKLGFFAFGVALFSGLLSSLLVKPFDLGMSFKRTFVLASSYGNHVFLGIPVAYALLGEGGGGIGYLLCYRGLPLPLHYRLLHHDGQYGPFRFNKKSVSYLSDSRISLPFLRIQIPPLLSHTFSLMNMATFPLSMVVVGGGLSLKFFLRSSNILHIFMGSLIKLIISPLLAYFAASALSLPFEQLAVCVLLSASPAAVLVTIFSVKYDGDVPFGNSMVTLTTLASIGTFPLIFLLLKG